MSDLDAFLAALERAGVEHTLRKSTAGDDNRVHEVEVPHAAEGLLTAVYFDIEGALVSLTAYPA